MQQPVTTERELPNQRPGNKMGRGDVPIILCVGKSTSARSALYGHYERLRVSTYRIVFLGEVRGQEEGCFGDFATEHVLYRKTNKETELQSTKPFQAETDALRAVSIVPPITTSF